MDDRETPRSMSSQDVVTLQRWVDYQWSKSAATYPWFIDSLRWGEERALRIRKLNKARNEIGMLPIENDEITEPWRTLMRRLWSGAVDEEIRRRHEAGDSDLH